jgi:uncharacterized protein (DUF2062 family)
MDLEGRAVLNCKSKTVFKVNFMIRKFLKRISTHPKILEFLNRYNIPKEYFIPTRKMVARGVFIGTFIAFIPMPMQMAAVVALSPFFRFNIPIAVAMCWITNPITMPIIYYIEYLTGTILLNIEPEPVELTIEWFTNNMAKIFIPLYVGALFYSIVGAITGYLLVNLLWRSSVKRERNSKGKI